jgi:hypothetical protein
MVSGAAITKDMAVDPAFWRVLRVSARYSARDQLIRHFYKSLVSVIKTLSTLMLTYMVSTKQIKMSLPGPLCKAFLHAARGAAVTFRLSSQPTSVACGHDGAW